MALLAQTLDLGELQPPSEAFAPDISSQQGAVAPLAKFLTTFIGFLTILAGLMFMIYFIISALSWVTAGGDKGKIEHARNGMTNGALGLMIVVASYAIVGIVGGVLGIDILNPVTLILSIVP